MTIGETVVSSLNTPSLFLIAKDLTKMQVWTSVNEADIGGIFPNQPVTFTVDAFPNRVFKGTVGKVRYNATMTQNVVTYTVEVNTDNSDLTLLPYLTAQAEFETGRRTDVLTVPAASLRWTPDISEVVPGSGGRGAGSGKWSGRRYYCRYECRHGWLWRQHRRAGVRRHGRANNSARRTQRRPTK